MKASLILDLVLLAILLAVAFGYARKGFLTGLIQFAGNLASLIGAVVLSQWAAPVIFEKFLRPGCLSQVEQTIEETGGVNLEALIEKYAGAFPTWLAPVQARIMTITDRADDWAYEVKKALEQKGVRVEIDTRNEKIGFKIREAQTQKIPYMLVLGDKEVEEKKVAVRGRAGDLGAMDLDAFIAKIVEEIETKAR